MTYLFSVQAVMAVEVVVAEVVAAAAAGTATRTTDMVAATMAMAARAVAVTDGNDTDDPFTSSLPLSGTSEHCSFWT